MKSGMNQLGLFVEVGENTHETTVPLNKNSLIITERHWALVATQPFPSYTERIFYLIMEIGSFKSLLVVNNDK